MARLLVRLGARLGLLAFKMLQLEISRGADEKSVRVFRRCELPNSQALPFAQVPDSEHLRRSSTFLEEAARCG
eukprot:scaffold180_cov311-Pinguiococcus_pyrenoidosus.AAC.47